MLAFPRAHPAAFRWMGKPFAELVAAHVQEPEAQAALYRLAGYVTDRPEELGVFDMVPLFGYYFHGGYYPKGGSGMLGQVLADAVTRHGGQVRLKSAVAEILVENGRAVGIRLASGERIAARAVMSNADLRRTFLTLLPEAAVPEEFRAVMAAAEPATSAFMVHLGLDRQPELPPIASVETADGLKVGLVSPSKVDPSAAPAGYATLELITLLPQAEARRWFPEPEVVDAKAYRGSAEYEAAKQALGDRLITAAEQLIPGLRGHIVLRVDASPLTFARYDWSSGGAIYGVAQRDRFDGVKSPLPGLYLAGAGNQGPGVEAVMIAGARAAESIIPGLLRRAPARAEPAPAPRWNAELSLARG
jgi:phytoene dehydrogenase-like protein